MTNAPEIPQATRLSTTQPSSIADALSTPRELCKDCYNWCTQEDVGPNDFPQCGEGCHQTHNYLIGLSNTCPKHLKMWQSLPKRHRTIVITLYEKISERFPKGFDTRIIRRCHRIFLVLCLKQHLSCHTKTRKRHKNRWYHLHPRYCLRSMPMQNANIKKTHGLYTEMMYLSTDASGIRKAMEFYSNFLLTEHYTDGE